MTAWVMLILLTVVDEQITRHRLWKIS